MLNQQHTDWRASGTQFSHFGGLLALNSRTSGATGTGVRDTGATGMLPIQQLEVRMVAILQFC